MLWNELPSPTQSGESLAIFNNSDAALQNPSLSFYYALFAGRNKLHPQESDKNTHFHSPVCSVYSHLKAVCCRHHLISTYIHTHTHTVSFSQESVGSHLETTYCHHHEQVSPVGEQRAGWPRVKGTELHHVHVVLAGHRVAWPAVTRLLLDPSTHLRPTPKDVPTEHLSTLQIQMSSWFQWEQFKIGDLVPLIAVKGWWVTSTGSKKGWWFGATGSSERLVSLHYRSSSKALLCILNSIRRYLNLEHEKREWQHYSLQCKVRLNWEDMLNYLWLDQKSDDCCEREKCVTNMQETVRGIRSVYIWQICREYRLRLMY